MFRVLLSLLMSCAVAIPSVGSDVQYHATQNSPRLTSVELTVTEVCVVEDGKPSTGKRHGLWSSLTTRSRFLIT